MNALDLKQLTESFKQSGLWVEGSLSGSCSRILSDSRKVASADSSERILYFARSGVARDGHEFLKSLEGSSAICGFVVERDVFGFKPRQPVLRVRNATRAMAQAIKYFYGDPSQSFFLGAVTGTNGKTTTTYLMQALLKNLGYRVGRSGTIESEFEGWSAPSELTTPDFEQLQQWLCELKARGASSLVFEASSHALDQGRLLGLEIDAAIFTNLTPEHLDYHRTMENYYQAKRKLFVELLAQSTKPLRFAIVPLDGSYGSRLCDDLSHQTGLNVITWTQDPSLASKAQYWMKESSTSLSGNEVTVMVSQSQEILKFKTFLAGSYNAENLMGVVCLGLSMGAKPDQIQRAFDVMPPVPGRLERVVSSHPGFVFVDYAHTPDALENVLMTLRSLTKGRLRVVFGCGGDRDRLKRPKMGGIAELYADEIFVTSDNPRTEDPELIVQEILQGMQRLKPVHVDIDRRRSIAAALEGLKPQDVVLIAGKGHETYQILGTEKFPFDDRQVVREIHCSSKTV